MCKRCKIYNFSYFCFRHTFGHLRVSVSCRAFKQYSPTPGLEGGKRKVPTSLLDTVTHPELLSNLWFHYVMCWTFGNIRLMKFSEALGWVCTKKFWQPELCLYSVRSLLRCEKEVLYMINRSCNEICMWLITHVRPFFSEHLTQLKRYVTIYFDSFDLS